MTSGAQTQADVHFRQRFVLVVTTVLLVLSTLTVVLRVWARGIIHQRLRSDDIWMLLALPFSYIDGICQYLALNVGLGKHASTVSKADQLTFRKILFALQRGNPPCLFCVKTSILCFYMNLFPTKKFKMVAKGMIIFTGLWAIAAFVSNLLQCLPVAFFWDKTIKGGHCISVTPIGVANASLSLVGDVFILLMPLPMIWNLQLNKRKKVALTGIFLLGAFTCVISLIRVILLPKLNIKDATFTQVFPGTLTYAELGVAIICGNLPVMGPLFGRWFRNKMSSYRSNKLYAYGYGHNAPGNSITAGNYSKGTRDRDGFARMPNSKIASQDDRSGSDVELTIQGKPDSEPLAIEVTRELEVDYGDSGDRPSNHGITPARGHWSEVQTGRPF